METRVVNRVPEWRFQAEVISRLHQLEKAGLPLTCAGDMNRAKRNSRERAEAKATGLTAGEPDVRVYLTGGVLVCYELKTPDGSRSKDQRDRHKLLISLGFEIFTIKAKTPVEMADLIEADVRARLTA